MQMFRVTPINKVLVYTFCNFESSVDSLRAYLRAYLLPENITLTTRLFLVKGCHNVNDLLSYHLSE